MSSLLCGPQLLARRSPAFSADGQRFSHRRVDLVARAATGDGMQRLSPASSASSPAPVRDPSKSSPYRISIWRALRFNGAPERINGRLAMVALLVAARSESLSGDTVLGQLASPDWGVLVAMALIVWGSLVPVTAGAIDEPFGVFTPLAERVNGRMAMLGFGALLALEWYTDVPFF